jgi:Trk K+ transport system NAD-binding subunit
MNQPIILCGLGTVGGRVLEILRAAGLSVVVIDRDCTDDDPRLQGTRLVRGDFRLREVLSAAGVVHARGILILTSDDLLNISTALTIRHLDPDVRVVLRLFNQNLIARLAKAIRNVTALSTATLTAPLIALTALTGQALGSFRIDGLAEGRRQVAEVTVTVGSSVQGQSVGQLVSRSHAQVVAHLPTGGPARWMHAVDLTAALAAGDRLVLCGEPRWLTPLLAEKSAEGDLGVLWAGWLRRQWRALRRTIAEIDRPVKICTIVLFSVILLSTLAFWTVRKYGPPQAFFRAISVMATSSDMHAEQYDQPWHYVFAACLRIIGAALTATFTAILTNYLLRARLGGALEVRRIPEGGHVVVCGLGNVGFCVVEELLAQGERVVAVEVARDNRFIATARRQGVAVIHGDATVAEVLRQANAAKARAVIACSNVELVNLETTLLVREENPQQRVVLRLSDPDLARMVREAAGVRLALSVSALAAPAFVAALFGDRVLSVFLLEGRLMAVLDLIIGDQDRVLIGQSVRAAAVDYQFVPLAVLPRPDTHASLLLNMSLAVGDRLIALLALADMQRLVRREPVPGQFAVEVNAFPLPARSWVAGLVRMERGISAEEADKALNHLPLSLGKRLTRGQAEDLLARLYRERVTARLRKEE